MTDRLPSENDRQYLAYTCYRDLGLNRSLLAAQRIYDQKTGKNEQPGARKSTSGSFDGWSRTFDWEERAKAWDAEQAKIRIDMMQQANKDNFMAELADAANLIKDVSKTALNTAKIAMSITQKQVEILEQESLDRKLDAKQLDNLAAVLKCSRDATFVLQGGTTILQEAMGVADLHEAITKLEAKK